MKYLDGTGLGTVWNKIKATFATKTEIPTITDTYNASSSNGMSGKAVASAIASAITDTLGGNY